MLTKAKEKFIGDKAFYRMVLAVAVPIMIQNGITNFVGLLDNIMVGQVGTEQMSGVAIVNQLMMVYYLCVFLCVHVCVHVCSCVCSCVCECSYVNVIVPL